MPSPLAAALLALALPRPAAALTPSQLANQVRHDRALYDNALRGLEKDRQRVNDAEERLARLQQEAQDGKKRGTVAGEGCAIEACIGREQRIIARDKKAADAELQAARKDAEAYVQKEQQYAAATGHNLDPTTLGEAQDFLAGPKTIVGTPPQTTDGGPTPQGPGCVDKYGIPCIPPGTDNPIVDPAPTDAAPPPLPTPQVDPGLLAGGAPGTHVGDLGTGHEADDLSKWASHGAQTLDASASPSLAVSGGGGGFRPGSGAEEGSASDALASARASLQRGALFDAGGAVARGLRADPRSYDLNVLDAQVRNSQGDWAGSEKAARRAIALNPNDPAAYKALAVSLLHQGRAQEALEAAEKAVEKDPDDAESLMLRAFAFEGLGRKDEMMRDVLRAASLDPRFEGYLKLARLGKVLFDRRRTLKGWRGFPVPDVEEPGAGPGSRLPVPATRNIVLLGGLLVAAAASLLGYAAWAKRRGDPGAIRVRTATSSEPPSPS